MRDVMSRSRVFSICDGRSGSVSHKRRSFTVVKFAKTSKFEGLRSSSSSSSKIGFLGKSLKLSDLGSKPIKGINPHALSVQMTLSFPKAMKWWKKGLQPNMKEIESAQDLVESLRQAVDKLVSVDFFSPGCGGCKALHPMICQFAEANPDVMLLQVNYEEHKSICFSLNVHVLPFFGFYRGAIGQLCSFSCTNATMHWLSTPQRDAALGQQRG